MGMFDSFKVKRLIKDLKDENANVRGQAARVLGWMGGERAVEPLIEALKDEDWHVREEAAMALGEIGDERAVEPLIQALKDEDWDVRWKAAMALGEIGWRPKEDIERVYLLFAKSEWDELVKLGKTSVEPLIQALNDKYLKVRTSAAMALGEMGDERAVEPLIQALKYKDGGVRWKAAETLDKLGWAPRNDTEKARYDTAKAPRYVIEPIQGGGNGHQIFEALDCVTGVEDIEDLVHLVIDSIKKGKYEQVLITGASAYNTFKNRIKILKKSFANEYDIHIYSGLDCEQNWIYFKNKIQSNPLVKNIFIGPWSPEKSPDIFVTSEKKSGHPTQATYSAYVCSIGAHPIDDVFKICEYLNRSNKPVCFFHDFIDIRNDNTLTYNEKVKLNKVEDPIQRNRLLKKICKNIKD